MCLDCTTSSEVNTSALEHWVIIEPLKIVSLIFPRWVTICDRNSRTLLSPSHNRRARFSGTYEGFFRWHNFATEISAMFDDNKIMHLGEEWLLTNVGRLGLSRRLRCVAGQAARDTPHKSTSSKWREGEPVYQPMLAVAVCLKLRLSNTSSSSRWTRKSPEWSR